MQTAITKKVDGYQIICGFDKLHIDPIATKKKTNEFLKTLNEYKNLQKIAGQIGQKVSEYSKLASTKKGDIASFQQLKREIEDLQKGYKEQLQKIQKQKEAHKEKWIVYFIPKEEEIILADNTLFNKFKKLKANELLTIEGKIIQNNIGRQYWVKENEKWDQETINKLGEIVPENGKLELSSEEQIEVENQRIANLSTEKKQIEQNSQLEKAMKRSIEYRNKLEILDEKNALRNAQAMYKKEAQEIKERYK